jgi:hypothetical protein
VGHSELLRNGTVAFDLLGTAPSFRGLFPGGLEPVKCLDECLEEDLLRILSKAFRGLVPYHTG